MASRAALSNIYPTNQYTPDEYSIDDYTYFLNHGSKALHFDIAPIMSIINSEGVAGIPKVFVSSISDALMTLRDQGYTEYILDEHVKALMHLFDDEGNRETSIHPVASIYKNYASMNYNLILIFTDNFFYSTRMTEYELRELIDFLLRRHIFIYDKYGRNPIQRFPRITPKRL